jgi:hypothetical protein
MKLVMSTTVAAITLICAAALVATPADAKKRVKKPAAAPASQMAYDGSAVPPPRGAGGPVRSGNWCFKFGPPGMTTGSQYGYWRPCQ